MQKQQQHGNINTEDANKYKDEQWIKEMLAAHLAEERAYANAARLKWEEDLKRKVSQAVTPYMTQAYKDEVRIEELNTSLETERIRADKAENLAEECIQLAEKETKHLEKAYAEIQTKDTRLRELLHQNKQLAKSEQEQVILEETLGTLQTLLDKEKERTEIAEDKAKEWERKYNEIQAQNCYNKDKKRPRANNKNKPSMTHDEAIKQFAMNQLEEAQQEPLQMLTTKELHESFLDNSEDNRPTFIHFSREIAKLMEEIFPNVRHARNSSYKGYTGIKIKAT